MVILSRSRRAKGEDCWTVADEEDAEAWGRGIVRLLLKGADVFKDDDDSELCMNWGRR